MFGDDVNDRLEADDFEAWPLLKTEVTGDDSALFSSNDFRGLATLAIVIAIRIGDIGPEPCIPGNDRSRPFFLRN